MARITYLTALSAVIISFLLIAAACGTSPQAVPPAPEANTPPPETTIPGAFEIDIMDFSFSPATVTVPAGTTVTWYNRDSVPHTATSRTPLFDSGRLSRDESFSYTFSQTGSYEYYCTIHPYMTGNIVVE